MIGNENMGVNQPQNTAQGFHIMAKPIGPLCNLRCEYCFYTEKQAFFPKVKNYRMTEKVLKTYIRKNIALNKTAPEIPFTWQGGEPTLVGLEFFREVVRLQRESGEGDRITNSLQTNGTLLDDTWCEFLARHHFLVGISLDGPEDIHDRYRTGHNGKLTFGKVLRGINLLLKHGVEFNVLACVSGETARRPQDVYDFFKSHGVEFIQFIPIVERMPDAAANRLGLKLAMPPASGEKGPRNSVTSWTVEPEAYGGFLINVFDEWVRNDVGSVMVMNFEWALNAWIGNESPVCHFSTRCGRSLIMEHNGDLYSCDHFVYPEYRLGNILQDKMEPILNSPQQQAFGARKETSLPEDCRSCKVLFACRGGCPKHRFLETSSGEPGLNYLCKGYQEFFRHINKYMRIMVQLLSYGEPASLVMDAIRGPLVIKLDREREGVSN